MKKVQLHSTDITQQNIDKIKELFPSVVTESKDEQGNLRKCIDFVALKQLLSDEIAEEDKESYEFTWVGKGKSIAQARQVTYNTLRPCKEESKNWHETENLYLEGDNLEVLKLLQESYLNKVKMIYIDPPYNTGNDFIYNDNFTMNKDEYEEELGMYDEEDNRLFKNSDSNGRFHSDWCSMLYSRLLLARNLLTDDGVIFVSIDDNEVHNLRKMCDEVFGEENFVSILVWEKKKKGSFLDKKITNIKEYLLVYCKKENFFKGLVGEINYDMETYPCINASNKRDKRIIKKGITSKYVEKDFFMKKGSIISDTTMTLLLHSDLVIKKGALLKDVVIEANWRYSQYSLDEYVEKGELYITRDLYIRRIVNDSREKMLKDLLYKSVFDENEKYLSKINYDNISNSGWGTNEDADEELRLILGVQKILDYPKPVRLLMKIMATLRDKNSVILDFFSGSATTAHAVMQLNAEDGGKRKFIMVQLPEVCGEDSEAYKAGYKNICEIGKERIRRAGEKIVVDRPEAKDLDIGFRVLRLDSSNMKDVYFAANEYEQGKLESLLSNIKEDRTELDLLYDCLLRLGLGLAVEHQEEVREGVTIHKVNGKQLMACFADAIGEEIVEYIAGLKPEQVVFKDSSFASDQEKINLTEVFKLHSPSTVVKVI